MCGRFVLITDLKNIQKDFDIQDLLCQHQPSWNITPSQSVPVIICQYGSRQLVACKWGLIPSFSKDQSHGRNLINARAETVDKKPSFRNAFKKKRCLIVADGFYEWKKGDQGKTPQFFYLKSGRPFGFAGLYETWISPDKQEINTCVIITTTANELINPVHDRMPVILPKDKERVWLDSNVFDATSLLSILEPYPAGEMQCKSGMGPHVYATNK